ncbi:MAG: class I SAM-dependent methyltransferase [Candidatus Sungbacteria bacterium]|uniref:Class I SAM-dependent methyltransferase n=1 Tax=Candidatus Sungiibacteriota bacterium TaxID=2750080 RepID=A0A9D6LMY7_9BACT|nr:class I SAM-dependent methyltransferase [Candidatus Sungbacteria bacterium]
MEGRKESADHSEEGRPRRVFIDLGTNSLPVTAMGSREFSEDETYIGVDKSRKYARQNQELAKDDFPENENIHFLQADAKKLPVRNESVDEVFLGNLLGSSNISEEEKNKFLQEAKRILKTGGKVIVKETNTPALPQDFVDMARRNGFILEKAVSANSPEWPEAVRPYEAVAGTDFMQEHHKELQSFIAFLKLPDK